MAKSIIALLVIIVGVVQFASCGEKVSCENKKLSIRCNEMGARIDITSAMYGRQSKNHCWKFYGHLWSTKCKSSKSKSEVKKSCQGKSQCEIYAKNGVFGDPCRGTEKYLEVKYQCRVDGGFSKWTDYGKCSKSCGGGSHSRSRTCTNPPPKNGGNNCKGDHSKSKACNNQPCPVNGGYSKWSNFEECSESCGGGEQTRSRSCDNPKPAHGGEDCSDLGDATETKPCNTQACPVPVSAEVSRHVCEWGDMTIDCGGSAKIMITAAMYGRQTKDICWKWHGTFWSTSCKASSSLTKAKATCEGKTSCTLNAMNNVFGDPCWGTQKYLQVSYRCKG